MNPVSWPKTVFTNPPKTYPAPGFEEPGVKALFYDGLPWQGKPTRVFAWYGVPKNATGKKLPAMVLVHGGGGTAFAHWVRMWNERGYVAIAMDTCGCTAGGEHANRPRHDLGGPAGWGDFDHIDWPIEDQWPFHAVADVILAHTLIRSFPEVDCDRIGVTGISWGGYLTCITAGVDHRFQFAAPVYGCGFLHDKSGWASIFSDMGKARADKWLALWDPAQYLPASQMPMLWVSGTNDIYYHLGALKRSYQLPAGPRTLCIRVRMPHGHPEGENPQEIQVFADHILKGTAPLPTVGLPIREGNHVRVAFTTKTPVARAELNFTRDSGNWPDRNWETLAAQLDLKTNTASADLPPGITTHYFNLVDDKGNVVSSEHETLS